MVCRYQKLVLFKGFFWKFFVVLFYWGILRQWVDHLKRTYLGGETSNIFYVHPETWGRWTQFDSYFANGLKPPTSMLAKGPYKPISRDCAIYFSITVGEMHWGMTMMTNYSNLVLKELFFCRRWALLGVFFLKDVCLSAFNPFFFWGRWTHQKFKRGGEITNHKHKRMIEDIPLFQWKPCVGGRNRTIKRPIG